MKLIFRHCTCVLLFMAAVSGGTGPGVRLRLIEGPALRSVRLLRLAVAVGGQTTQGGGAIHLPPAVRRPADIRFSVSERWFVKRSRSGKLGGELVCVRVCVCGHLMVEVLQGGVSGSCRRRQSLSLMLSVSSGDSRHTKIQLRDKRPLKIQRLIPA